MKHEGGEPETIKFDAIRLRTLKGGWIEQTLCAFSQFLFDIRRFQITSSRIGHSFCHVPLLQPDLVHPPQHIKPEIRNCADSSWELASSQTRRCVLSELVDKLTSAFTMCAATLMPPGMRAI